jgi:hypothetical protein
VTNPTNHRIRPNPETHPSASSIRPYAVEQKLQDLAALSALRDLAPRIARAASREKVGGRRCASGIQ